MTASWTKEKGFDPCLIAQKLEEIKTTSASGKTTYEGYEHDQLVTMLYSMVDFSEPLPEKEKRRIVSRATFEAGRIGKITKDGLLTEIKRLERRYLNLPYNRYILITSLSLSRSTPLRRTKFNDALIIFESQIPKRFANGLKEIEKHPQVESFTPTPQNFIYTRIHISARSEYEAINKGLTALNAVRGIWNLYYNHTKLVRFPSDKRQPVNNIVLGPFHTLHEPNGKPATPIWWYEPYDFRAIRVKDPTNDIESLYQFLTKVRRRLAKISYRQELETAIIRYTMALDERDRNTAILKLWSLLEYLTHSTNDNYKVLMRRASYVFDERDYYKQILNHLRYYRNKLVHEDVSDTEVETTMYQVKLIVESLLRFHIFNRFGLRNLQHVSEFLDLSSDESDLESRIKLLKYAQKFRGYN